MNDWVKEGNASGGKEWTARLREEGEDYFFSTECEARKENAISRAEIAEVFGVQDVDDWIGRGKKRGNHGIIAADSARTPLLQQ